MRLIIGMGKGSTSDEIMDYFDLNTDIMPSQSAFAQRRSQISLSAFQFLFSEFSSSFPETTNQFKDHCILAFDGCHVVYATNAEIIEDYNVPRLVDYKGHNHMHLNGFVDVISKAFIDVMIQPGSIPTNELQCAACLNNSILILRTDTSSRQIVVMNLMT